MDSVTLYGVSGKYLKNLIEGKAEACTRQIVENEDYRKSVPQLKYAEPDPTEVPHDQGDPGSGSRPSEAAHDYASAPTSAPKVFGPGGVQYDPPKPDEPMEKPNVDLRPRSGSVGASAKPKAQPAAPKSQPQSPAPKPMPSSGLLLDDHLHHLYQPGDKMRVELKARTQLILVPQMSLHNLHCKFLKTCAAPVQVWCKFHCTFLFFRTRILWTQGPINFAFEPKTPQSFGA